MSLGGSRLTTPKSWAQPLTSSPALQRTRRNGEVTGVSAHAADAQPSKSS